MRSRSGSSEERTGRAAPTAVQAVILVIVAALVIVAVWVGVGFLLSKVLNDDAVGRTDRSLSRLLVRNRTGELNQATHWVTYLSETETVIAAGLLIAIVARLAWKRWRESMFVAAALFGEVSTFLGVTSLVDRSRPSVPRLDAAPPTSSFPSGHTAAAVVLYGILAILISRRFQSVALTWTFRVVAVAVPLAVGAARLYRGMHFLTDVLFGAALGAVWLVVSLIATRPGDDDHGTPGRSSAPAPLRR